MYEYIKPDKDCTDENHGKLYTSPCERKYHGRPNIIKCWLYKCVCCGELDVRLFNYQDHKLVETLQVISLQLPYDIMQRFESEQNSINSRDMFNNAVLMISDGVLLETQTEIEKHIKGKLDELDRDFVDELTTSVFSKVVFPSNPSRASIVKYFCSGHDDTAVDVCVYDSAGKLLHKWVDCGYAQAMAYKDYLRNRYEKIEILDKTW